MNLATLSGKKPAIEDVKDQFENWRQTRENRGRIPDRLWEAAVSLCQTHSISQVSKTLRLNHTDLKLRVQACRSNCQPCVVTSPSFIDLGVTGPITAAECIIEMENTNGAKMKMHFKGQAGLDLLALGKAFWRKGS